MEEITFQVEVCPDSGELVASWDDPQGGGITTQGPDLSGLQVADAVRYHFDPTELPKRLKFHFASDPVLTTS